MSSRKNQHIYSAALNEYAYRVLVNTTPEQRLNFTDEEMRMFESEWRLQKFIKEEVRLDMLLYLLAKVGISWTLRLEKDPRTADLCEFHSYEQYKYPQKRLDVTEATSREGVVAVSSREVMVLSHMLSQNCTSKVYYISEFNKLMASKMKNLGQLTTWDSTVKEAQRVHDDFNMLLLQQLNAMDYARDMMGLDEVDLRILSALFAKRNSAVSLGDLVELTKGSGRKMYYRKNMQKMVDAGWITTDCKDLKKAWPNTTYLMITTAGLGKILAYHKLVHKNAFGT